MDVKYLRSIIDKCTKEIQVGINFYLFVILFQIVSILFTQLIFVCDKCLIKACSRAIVELINNKFGITNNELF